MKKEKETIREALEKSIPEKGNCKICPHRFRDTCDITEEKIGSGETYCDLTALSNKEINQ